MKENIEVITVIRQKLPVRISKFLESKIATVINEGHLVELDDYILNECHALIS